MKRYILFTLAFIFVVIAGVVVRYNLLPDAVHQYNALYGSGQRYWVISPDIDDTEIYKAYVYRCFFCSVKELNSKSVNELIETKRFDRYILSTGDKVFIVNRNDEWIDLKEVPYDFN